MKGFITGLIVGGGAAMALATFGQERIAKAPGGVMDEPPAGCSAETVENNKRVGESFFQMKPGDTQAMYNILDPDYRQHNPIFKRFGEINHFHGREEFTGLMSLMRRGGAGGAFGPPPGGVRPPPGNPLYRVIADCNVVVVLQQRYLPDPQYAGKFYEAFWFDAWRIKDNRFAEHWDAATIPTPVPAFLTTPLKDMKPSGPTGGRR